VTNPIYLPKGSAKGGYLALNIYNGCPHACTYCYAPMVMHKDRMYFHNNVTLRPGIVEAVKFQVNKTGLTNKLIHVCFACDPYPRGIDTTATRDIIKILKDAGNHLHILTKGGDLALRDFDLLDCNDQFGITLTGGPDHEPNAASEVERLRTLIIAKSKCIQTWVCCEPVFNPNFIYDLIVKVDFIDYFVIGKLNYNHSSINWKEFGNNCEYLCNYYNRNYTIKHELRECM